MHANIKKMLAGLAVVGLLAFVGWELLLLSKAPAVLNGALDFSKRCEAGDKLYCTVAVSTARNVETQLRFIPASQEFRFVDSKSIAQLRNEILPRIKPIAESYERDQEAQHQALMNRGKKTMESLAKLQEAQQQDAKQLMMQYSALAAPKLLYRCGDSINLIAGSGLQNYNDIFERATASCTRTGSEVEVLKSEK